MDYSKADNNELQIKACRPKWKWLKRVYLPGVLKGDVMTATIWQLDGAHSSAGFAVKHMMISKVHGTFSKMSGTLQYDGGDITKAQVEAKVDVSSINTNDAQRDTHLKSADFFDAEKFPQIIFKSRKIEKNGSGLKISGDLTMHGATKEVVFNVDGPSQEVKDPHGNIKIGASATTTLKRKEFGLMWNAALETGGVMVSDDVALSIDVQFAKKA